MMTLMLGRRASTWSGSWRGRWPGAAGSRSSYWGELVTKSLPPRRRRPPGRPAQEHVREAVRREGRSVDHRQSVCRSASGRRSAGPETTSSVVACSPHRIGRSVQLRSISRSSWSPFPAPRRSNCVCCRGAPVRRHGGGRVLAGTTVRGVEWVGRKALSLGRSPKNDPALEETDHEQNRTRRALSSRVHRQRIDRPVVPSIQRERVAPTLGWNP